MNYSRLVSGEVALAPGFSVDYIIQHPHSSNLGVTPEGILEPRLSVMSEMSIVSALTLWEEHKDSTVVITGETCFDEELPNTSDLMLAKAREISDIPADQLVALSRLKDGRALNNTYLQFEDLAEYFSAVQNPRTLLASTLRYHMKRFARAANAYGLDANFVVAEDVLHANGNHDFDQYLPIIDRGTRLYELFLRLENSIDRKGRLLNVAVGKAGARVVDVSKKYEGELYFENTTGPNKLERMKQKIADRASA